MLADVAGVVVWIAGIGTAISLVVWLIVFVGERYIYGNFDSLIGIGETPQEAALAKARREAVGAPDPAWKDKPKGLPGRRILVATVVLLIVTLVTAWLR